MRALIFDLGNVVTFFDHRRACRQLAQLSASPLSEEAVHRAIFASSLESDFDCGRVSAPAFIQQLRRVLNLSAADEAVADAWSEIFWGNEDVQSLLPRLKSSKARMILASNTNELHFRQIGRQFPEAMNFFDESVLSFELGFRKPQVAFFERCVEVAGAAPKHCIYIDDRPDFVAVAGSMGMNGIVYQADLDLLTALNEAGWSEL